MSNVPPEMAEAIDHVHVMPINDLVDHHAGDDCVCGPRVEAVFRDDGSNGWLSVHHALDKRV